MLKFSRGKLIVFDIEEALSFEGETGPLPAVRGRARGNILRKLQEREGSREARRPRVAGRTGGRRAGWRRRRRRPRPVGARARGIAARRDRRAGRSIARNSRGWRNARSASHSSSTRSIIGIRSSTKEQADRKRWRAAGVAYVRRQLTAGARSDGDRGSGADVIDRGLADSRECYGCHRHYACPKARGLPAGNPPRRRRGARLLEVSTHVEAALTGVGRPDADRRRRRRARPLRRSRRTPASRKPKPGATSSRLRAGHGGARAQNLPIFAICRGMQVLNVACGGTLVQDIPSQVDRRTRTQPAGAAAPSHTSSRTRSGSRRTRCCRALMRERLARRRRCEVNSRHHQAVKAVAPGFKVSATRAGRRGRSDRRSVARRSASASSGIRKTSGGPASSARPVRSGS